MDDMLKKEIEMRLYSREWEKQITVKIINAHKKNSFKCIFLKHKFVVTAAAVFFIIIGVGLGMFTNYTADSDDVTYEASSVLSTYKISPVLQELSYYLK
jgi:ABC-type proline/glycine betaine transport system permease subunit